MLKGIRGKQILVLGLVAVILVAGYVRWTNEEGDGAIPAMSTGETEKLEPTSGISSDGADITIGSANLSAYFVEAKQSKDRARSEAIEVLNAVISNKDSSAEAKATAQTKINTLAKNIEKEAITESLIKAKGIAECAVFIDDANVSVVVKTDELNAAKVAQIQDIVMGQTGVGSDKIKISSI